LIETLKTYKKKDNKNKRKNTQTR